MDGLECLACVLLTLGSTGPDEADRAITQTEGAIPVADAQASGSGTSATFEARDHASVADADLAVVAGTAAESLANGCPDPAGAAREGELGRRGVSPRSIPGETMRTMTFTQEWY